MSIETVLSYIGDRNAADLILKNKDGEDKLKKLAEQVIDDYEIDKDSMIEWNQMVEDGRRIAKQDLKSSSTSELWEGSANFKTPAILNASISFGDRAVTEVLRGRNLIKIDVIGKDQSGQKKKSSENVTEFQNWQINYQMRGWRKAQERILYELPSIGAVFKKTFYDHISGINRSECLHYPDFVINQATTSIEKAKSFTQPMSIDVDEVYEKKTSGLWLDVDLYPEDAEGGEGSNEQEEVKTASDNDKKFLEQNCLFDFNDDGYRSPFIVTVHEQTKQVVRVVARYDLSDIIIKDGQDSVRRLNRDEFGNLEPLNGLELVRVEPTQNIVQYDFIPSPDGTFLGIGYYHLLSTLSRAVNKTTNDLMNAGTLANRPAGFLAKGFRKQMGNLRIKPGELIQTNLTELALQTGIKMLEFREPSAVLFALNEKLEQKIQELVISTDLKGVLAPNAPATTTLALIQEAMIPMSAIMQRIIMSESEEFRQLFILNAKFGDPELYKLVLDDREADFKVDFNPVNLDIMPTASSEMSSRMQRIQRAETMVSRVQEIALTGGDVQPIWDAWFNAIGADDLIGLVYPSKDSLNEEQKARAKQREDKDRQDSLMLSIQVDHAERSLVLKEKTGRAGLTETAANIGKIESEILLNSEKAESEEVKNRLNVYTAQLQGVREAIENTIKDIGQENAQRLLPENPAIPTGQPNIPG